MNNPEANPKDSLPEKVGRRGFLRAATLAAGGLLALRPNSLFAEEEPEETVAQAAPLLNVRENPMFQTHPLSWEIPDGMHFVSRDPLGDTDIHMWGYPEGYGVRGAMYQTMNQLGGPEFLSRPLSREFTDAQGYKNQLFINGILRVKTDADGNIIDIGGGNAVTKLIKTNNTSELVKRGVPLFDPKSLESKTQEQRQSEGNNILAELRTINPDLVSIFETYQGKLGYPVIANYMYIVTPDFIATMGDKGDLSLVNVGKFIRSKTDDTVIPVEYLLAEKSDRWQKYNQDKILDPGDAPLRENIHGTPMFVSQILRVINNITSRSPQDMQFIETYVKRIEQTTTSRPGAEVDSGIILIAPISIVLNEGSVELRAATLGHEARHIWQNLQGLKPTGRDSEADAIKFEVGLLKRMNARPEVIKVTQETLLAVDRLDPSK